MYWYFCQCIRDSAEGQIRAAHTTATTPGLGELAGQTLKLIACALVFVAPMIVHWANTQDFNLVPWILSGPGDFLLPVVLPVEVLRRIADTANPIPMLAFPPDVAPVFWMLWSAASFLFPMALLAMVMHDRLLIALNPILILRSIRRTFIHYCPLALACCFLARSLSAVYYLIFSPRYWHLSYVLLALAFYQMLIMAHLLGRFYFKNDEKLYWDA